MTTHLARLVWILLGAAGPFAVHGDAPAQQPARGPAAPAVAVGQVAPPLRIAKWLDGAEPVALGGGRAAMLVFWAPWCGSCVAEFGHLNELVAATAELPLSLVSISGEPEEKVAALLAKRPLRTVKALDDAGQTFAAYGVRVLPRVVLVAADGRIAALPRAGDVDFAVLRRLAAGEAIDLAEASQQRADLQWDMGAAFDAEASLAHAVIQRSSSASGGVRIPPGSGRITADGVGFANLVQIACGAEPHQLDAAHPACSDHDTRYRVSVKAPDGRDETARAMLRETLQRVVPFAAEWTEVEEPTLVLRRRPDAADAAGGAGTLRRSEAAKSGGGGRAGAIELQKMPMAKIAKMLGALGFGRAVLDETGLDGEWDVDWQWTPGDRASLDATLARCGLQIAQERRRVRKLRVEAP